MDTESLLNRAQEVRDEGRAECEKTRGLITESRKLLAQFDKVDSELQEQLSTD